MKSVDVKSNTYIGSNVKNNDKYPKFEHCKKYHNFPQFPSV